MARTWLITSRGIAKKVKNANLYANYQIKDLSIDAKRECPKCKHLIDNSDVTCEWPGLPAGVKFDPSDVELLDHLAGKLGLGNSKPHPFIDEFIPTLEYDEGICYTHPENLPGVKRNGSSSHFFYRTSNAYETGHRKRRKIHKCDVSDERIRWHKTGKTKPVLDNGIQKGWKKIMVLYRSSKKGCKPDKVNWVMHQYHLGDTEEEKDGELVVSKIFYQIHANQFDKSDMNFIKEEYDTFTTRVSPRTPKTVTPQPPRPKKSSSAETEKNSLPHLLGEEEVCLADAEPLPLTQITCLKDESSIPAWWAGESQAVEEPLVNELHESLLCHEVLDSFPPICATTLSSQAYLSLMSETLPVASVTANTYGDLDNILLGTPPDFQLADLQFGSQDSIMNWLDRL